MMIRSLSVFVIPPTARRRSTVTASLSLSLYFRWPMPVIMVGVFATAATMQSVWTVSGAEDMSMVIPEGTLVFDRDTVVGVRDLAAHLLECIEKEPVALTEPG